MPTAKPPLRLNRPKAEIVPVAQFEAWHTQAIQVPGLSDIERAILDAVASYWRHHAERGYAVALTYAALSESTGAEPVSVSTAIKRLVSLCLIGVRPGHGARASEYLLALPRQMAERLAAADEDADAVPW
jgi:hypothetical protein